MMKLTRRIAALGLAATMLGAPAKAGDLGQQVAQEARAMVSQPQEAGYKWGYSIDVFQNCCNNYEIIVDNEEIRADNQDWIDDGGSGNVSSKRLTANFYANGDGTSFLERQDGKQGTDRRMWGSREGDLENISIFFRHDPQNRQVTNIGDGTPWDKRIAKFNSLQQAGFNPGGLESCDTAAGGLRAEQQSEARYWWNASADPHSISVTSIKSVDPAGNVTLEKEVYKIQPDEAPFNGRADYMMTSELQFGRRFDDTTQTLVPDNQYAVHRITDINGETMDAGWYAETFAWAPGENGLKVKIGKLDNMGFSDADGITNIDLGYMGSVHTLPGGNRTVYNESIEFPNSVADTHTFYTQGGRFRTEGTAVYPDGSIQPIKWEPDQRNEHTGVLSSGRGFYENPANLEFTVKVHDACGPYGEMWDSFTAMTTLPIHITTTDEATGTVKQYGERGPLALSDTDFFPCQ